MVFSLVGTIMRTKLLVILLVILPVCRCVGTNSTKGKKGLGVSSKNFMCGDVAAFSGISWYYNWDKHPNEWDHPECGDEEAKPGFVPMIWGYGNNPFPELEFDTVLGFNEPNHQHQSNMDPEEAAYAWLELQAAYPDKILVSPSASPPNTEEWFDTFFEVCDVIGCRVDFLATHQYSGNADNNMEYINGLYQRYGRKIWFTEFAKPSTRDPDKELEYMKAILPMLEDSEAVWRYSWFVQRFVNSADLKEGTNSSEWYIDRAVSLLEEDSPTLTALGKYYDEF